MNTKYFFVLLGIFSFTVNFMFTGTKWKDAFPYVRFKVNPNLYGITPENQIKIISDAADLWFNGTDSKFSYSYDGQTTNTQSASPSQLDCSDETKNSLRQLENTVYSTSIPDPYCTSETCALIWSCGDEVLHFDIRINRVETELKARIAKEFGFVAGLSRCAVGDTPEDCTAKSVNGQSDPDTNSIMHKFASLAELSPDDKAGMQSLYGAFNNPFPKTGPYVLNSTEVEFLAGAENEFAKAIGSESINSAKIKESIGSLMGFIEATPEQIDLEIDQWVQEGNVQNQFMFPWEGQSPDKPPCKTQPQPTTSIIGLPITPTQPVEDFTKCKYTTPTLTPQEARARNAQEMSQFFSAIKGMIYGLSDMELFTARVNSVLAVNSFQKLGEHLTGDNRIDPSQFQEAFERWLSIRQETIDEQIRRIR